MYANDKNVEKVVKEELDQQEERLQNHLPGRYVVENDSRPERYEWGARALLERTVLRIQHKDNWII